MKAPAALRLLFVLVVLTGPLALRWGGLGQQIWSVDEGSTYTMAQQILAGDVPYRDAADNRNPLLAYFKAGVFALAGDWNIAAVQIALSLLIGIAGLLLWGTARRAGDGPAGVAAALWFILLSFVYLSAFDIMAVHTGWLMLVLSCTGFWAFAAAWQQHRLHWAATAGAALGLAFLAKQPGLLDCGTLLVVCALVAGIEPERRRFALRAAALLAAGFAAVVGLALAYFWSHDAIRDFLLYSWTYNTRYYVPEIQLGERLLGARMPFVLAAQHAPAALLAGGAAAILLLSVAWRHLCSRPRSVPLLPWLILGWTASGIVSTALSGRTFDHYSLQVLPGLCLACGWITARLWERIGRWRDSRKSAAAWAGRVGLAAAAASLTVAAAERVRELRPDDGTAREIGEFVGRLTGPRERIFVWGYSPETYVFARRLPSTRFLYTNYLTGLIPWTNLDLLKDTAYAVIPGSWDDFWRDWAKHPPAAIVDTLGQRGYLKYPLQKQVRLWSEITAHYAEIGGEFARSRGYRIFVRADATAAGVWDPAWSESKEVALTGPAAGRRASDARVSVRVPAGTRQVEIYLDGRLYRQVACGDARTEEVIFTVRGEDLAGDAHELRAVARGEKVLASAPRSYRQDDSLPEAREQGGPPLLFDGREYPAAETEIIDGSPVRLLTPPYWDAHAPSRMVYPRPPDLAVLRLRYGVRAPAYAPEMHRKTDGVVVVANFWETNGTRTELFKRSLHPHANPLDRGTQTSLVSLPLGRDGQIELLITPGPMADATADWSYWESLEGERAPLRLKFQGRTVDAVTARADFGVSVMEYQGQPVAVAHAPAIFEFPFQPGMVELTGGIGLLDQAWTGPQQTIGAVFEVIHVHPDGRERVLMQRSLDPANFASDRGIVPFRLRLPGAEGRLRLVARSPDATKNAYCYTFWHDLTAHEFAASLRFGSREIFSTEVRAEYGVNNMEEDGQTVIMAHAPSRIVFPLTPAMRRLEGSFGMLARSYTDGKTTAGATFIIEVEDASGNLTELLRRTLDPMAVTDDRGAHGFSVTLPGAAGGRLVLRTEAGPSGSYSYAWSYWRDLRTSP